MARRTRVLGLHTAGHDAAACLFEDGRLIYSIETERLTRVKHDYRVVPAISDLKAQTGLSLSDIDYVAVGTFVHPDLLSIPDIQGVSQRIASGTLQVETTCSIDGYQKPCLVVAHEACHAALACHYAPDPHAPTLVLTNEGRGTLGRSSLFLQQRDKLELLECDPLPWYGCGFGWSALAYALGFGKDPSVAGTIMGMGGHGRYSEHKHGALLEVDSEIMHRTRPEQEAIMAKFLAACSYDGSFESGAHLVATLQHMFTEVVRSYVLGQLERTGARQLALAGGCALNVICNSAIRAAAGLDIAIPPAPNDAGIALGAALYAQRHWLGITSERLPVFVNGKEPTTAEIEAEFARRGISARGYDEDEVAARLVQGDVVAYFEGKAEIGPRALGHRSLLGNPALPGMRHFMSERLKGREWFRPLAPVMRAPRFEELFPKQPASPYMLFSYAAEHAGIPEAVHVDGTARTQTLSEADHPRLYRLLELFEAGSGAPALINTSLNKKGKAIAHTCADVFDDFLDTDVALFVMGDRMGDNPRRSTATRVDAARSNAS